MSQSLSNCHKNKIVIFLFLIFMICWLNTRNIYIHKPLFIVFFFSSSKNWFLLAFVTKFWMQHAHLHWHTHAFMHQQIFKTLWAHKQQWFIISAYNACVLNPTPALRQFIIEVWSHTCAFIRGVSLCKLIYTQYCSDDIVLWYERLMLCVVFVKTQAYHMNKNTTQSLWFIEHIISFISINKLMCEKL